jgi:hypothetical protein
MKYKYRKKKEFFITKIKKHKIKKTNNPMVELKMNYLLLISCQKNNGIFC